MISSLLGVVDVIMRLFLCVYMYVVDVIVDVIWYLHEKCISFFGCVTPNKTYTCFCSTCPLGYRNVLGRTHGNAHK